MTKHWTAAEYRRMQGLRDSERRKPPLRPPVKCSIPTRRKYRNKPAWYDGIRYDSQLEADYAHGLDIKQKAGAITGWTRQVKFRIAENRTHRVDFLILKPDKTFEFVECKGMPTPEGELRRELVEQKYGIKITVVKK